MFKCFSVVVNEGVEFCTFVVIVNSYFNLAEAAQYNFETPRGPYVRNIVSLTLIILTNQFSQKYPLFLDD